MLSEMSEKDKYCMILFISGIQKSHTHRNREQNSGCQGLGGAGNTCQKMQTFSYKLNKSWSSNVQHGDYS